MKTAAAFDAVVGKSHAVNTKVELRAPDDAVVGVLPVTAGTIQGSATRSLGRWSGDLTLAGLEWAPDSATHPLAGLSGHYCSVQRAAQPYGQAETWVEVARLWVYSSSVTMSRRQAEMTVRLDSPAALLGRAVHDDFAAHGGGTAQQMIADVLTLNLPYTPAVVDSSPAASIPAQFSPQDVTPLQVADQLASAANVRVYFDALGRIVIRPTLPSLDVATLAPVRDMAVDVDVVRYQLEFGRDLFANDVAVRYESGRVGRAAITSGPLAKDGPAGRLTSEVRYDIDATQGKADEYADAVLTAQKQAWVTSRIDAVQDPRIEPDDIVETRYLDRTLRHRVVGVQFDLTTDQMQLTGRTTLGGS